MPPKGFTVRARWPVAAVVLIVAACGALAAGWRAAVAAERGRLVE